VTKIEAKAAGPIEGVFEIDLSPGFGAYQLCGGCGTGKTTMLNSIDLLAGHKTEITLHDGELEGHVTGWGVTVPIGSRKRRKGEMELDCLSEKFTPSDVIDPDGQTPEVRDARRIKALASLSGSKADESVYHELVGGQKGFAALGTQGTDDPVTLATRIKEKLDSVAREKTREAETEAGYAAPLSAVPEGLDMSASSDLNALVNERDNYRDARVEQLEAVRFGSEREDEIMRAIGKLDELQFSYDGPTVADAEAALIKTAAEHLAACNRTRELQAKLTEAEQDEFSADHANEVALAYRDTAIQHEVAIRTVTETAEATVSYPDEATLAVMETKVNEATERYNVGVRVRDVKRNQTAAKTHRDAAETASKAAAVAKNKASKVFDLLANSIQLKHITIQPLDGSPRLFVDHPKRKRCLFDQVNGLSDGERVDWTLRELLPHLKSPGLLPVPQRVWQDLQPADRMNLHKLAVERELYLFGAQVDDGPLRVEYLGEEALK
jgi:hypothetical protein